MKNKQKGPDSITCTSDRGTGIILLAAHTAPRSLETGIAVIVISIPSKVISTPFLFYITCFLFKD